MSRTIRATALFSLLLALLGGAPATAFAAAKLAFVVGIDRYDHLAADRQLRKAVGDARAVGETLAALGFEVTRVENAGRLDLVRQWQRFLNRVEPGDVTAFFFAGHGVEIGGLNYLVPRDVPGVASGEEEVLKAASLPLAGFLEQLRDRRAQLALVIVDACRDNPFTDARGRSLGATRGLARIDPPSGTFVMFSAGAGQTALDRLSDDDPDPNSVYTRALVKRLAEPGLGLPDIAREVRRDVLALARSAAHEQTPAYYDEVVGRFCPAGCGVTEQDRPSPSAQVMPRPPPPQNNLEPMPPPDVTCNAAEKRLISFLQSNVSTRTQFEQAHQVLQGLQDSVPSSCGEDKAVFGGPVTNIIQCHNKAIYIELGYPGSGAYVVTDSTNTFGFGLPQRQGEWVLGIVGPPYFCISSLAPLRVLPARHVATLGRAE